MTRHHAIAQADGHPGTANTLDRVSDLIAAAFGFSHPTQLHSETLFLEDLGIDAMAFALVIGVVEIDFDVRIPDRTAMQMRQVGDLVAWLDRQTDAGGITS